jgi:hypothetical protein
MKREVGNSFYTIPPLRMCSEITHMCVFIACEFLLEIPYKHVSVTLRFTVHRIQWHSTTYFVQVYAPASRGRGLVHAKRFERESK